MAHFKYRLNQPVIFHPFGGPNSIKATIYRRSTDKWNREASYIIKAGRNNTIVNGVRDHELEPDPEREKENHK